MSPDPADPPQGRRGQQGGAGLLPGGRRARRWSGRYHSALGYFSGAGPTDDEWKWAVDSMRQVAEHAEKCERDAGRWSISTASSATC